MRGKSTKLFCDDNSVEFVFIVSLEKVQWNFKTISMDENTCECLA
jgi:hypothetical protein